jgi:hypothetical protein
MVVSSDIQDLHVTASGLNSFANTFVHSSNDIITNTITALSGANVTEVLELDHGVSSNAFVHSLNIYAGVEEITNNYVGIDINALVNDDTQGFARGSVYVAGNANSDVTINYGKFSDVPDNYSYAKLLDVSNFDGHFHLNLDISDQDIVVDYTNDAAVTQFFDSNVMEIVGANYLTDQLHFGLGDGPTSEGKRLEYSLTDAGDDNTLLNNAQTAMTNGTPASYYLGILDNDAYIFFDQDRSGLTGVMRLDDYDSVLAGWGSAFNQNLKTLLDNTVNNVTTVV